MADETYRGLLENISETSGTYKQMLQAIAGGGGGSSGLCVLTDDTLDKSYNDLLEMVKSGIIPFFVYDNCIYMLGLLDPEGDGINFRQNSTSSNPLYFIMPDNDPDANLVTD